jgi:predicted nucleic acid-binding Zn ribbon protein
MTFEYKCPKCGLIHETKKYTESLKCSKCNLPMNNVYTKNIFIPKGWGK